MSISEAHPRGTDRKHSSRTSHESTGSRSPSIGPLLRYLEKLSAQNFFGKVVISFQHGKVHDVRIEQTMKMDEL